MKYIYINGEFASVWGNNIIPRKGESLSLNDVIYYVLDVCHYDDKIIIHVGDKPAKKK